MAEGRAAGRFAGVDGLRACAAGSIVVYHCWYWASPRGRPRLGPLDTVLLSLPTGVTLFFTLSGFLLFRPAAAALLRGRPLPRTRDYLRNRALRILPAYWVVLLLTTAVLRTTWLRTAGELHHGSLAGDPPLLLRTALLVQDYAPSSVLVGIGPAWSLAVEAAFYVVLPLLVLLAALAARRAATRRGRLTAVVLAPLVAGLVGAVGTALAARLPHQPGTGSFGADWYSVLHRSFLVQANLFTAGMLLAVLHVEVEDGRVRLPRGWRPSALLLALAVAVPAAVLHARDAVPQHLYDSVMAVACALLLAVVVLRGPEERPGRLTHLLEARPLALVGLVSYGLFLWHEPVMWWLQQRGLTRAGAVGFAFNTALVGAVSLALAALTYVLVERPALARKAGAASAQQRPRSRLQLAAPVRPRLPRQPAGAGHPEDEGESRAQPVV